MEKAETIIGGRYVFRKPLGKGGNGSVFLCYDTKLHKEWAVKKLCSQGSVKEGMESSQVSELEALKSISCSVFPRIVDVIWENETIYLIMDYVEGITLKERMTRKKLTEKEVLSWAAEIAKALRYLHQMSPQMLYLDCKPENIMLTTEGEIRLVDLGSAYICKSQRKQRLSGTYFFAPEELRDRKENGQMPDVRTDIYIFGMTLYCLLAGKRKEYRRKGKLWVRDANPNVSYGLNTIIAKCTEKEPGRRYQSMDEVLYQLAHVKELSRQEKGKNSLKKFAEFMQKAGIAMGCLGFARVYRTSNQIVYFICSLLLLCALLLLCKRRKNVVYEVKKDIFCGSGKRILGLAFMGVSLLTCMHMTSYAAQKKEADSKLPITIYDDEWRKLLIKDGTSWGVEQDIFLSVPIEEISEQGGKIEIVYTDENGGKTKQYVFYCHRK